MKQNKLELEKISSNKSKKAEKSADDDLTDDRFADADNLDGDDSNSEISEVSYKWNLKEIEEISISFILLTCIFMQKDFFFRIFFLELHAYRIHQPLLFFAYRSILCSPVKNNSGSLNRLQMDTG